MEAGFMVRGECLCVPPNPMSTAGDSSIYDGATFVKQSVARVRTSSNTVPLRVSALLVMGIIYRGHQSYSCP
jgi:hypothetical protein